MMTGVYFNDAYETRKLIVGKRCVDVGLLPVGKSLQVSRNLRGLHITTVRRTRRDLQLEKMARVIGLTTGERSQLNLLSSNIFFKPQFKPQPQLNPLSSNLFFKPQLNPLSSNIFFKVLDGVKYDKQKNSIEWEDDNTIYTTNVNCPTFSDEDLPHFKIYLYEEVKIQIENEFLPDGGLDLKKDLKNYLLNQYGDPTTCTFYENIYKDLNLCSGGYTPDGLVKY
jgi:hypothetical protein